MWWQAGAMLWWKSLFTKNLVPLLFSAFWGRRLWGSLWRFLFILSFGFVFSCFFLKQLRNHFTPLVHFFIFYVYMKIDITRSLKLNTQLLFRSPSTPLQRDRREIRRPKVRRFNGQDSLIEEEIKLKKNQKKTKDVMQRQLLTITHK